MEGLGSVFPFGYPFATAFYLVLYVLTLMSHVLFMNYVVGGSAYLAWASLGSGLSGDPTPEGSRKRALDVIRDWMPFSVSAAITAGVAPLLFVQVLYKRNFYTANLLLFHRWMLILPILIIAFYLFYLLKSRAVTRWPSWLFRLVGVGAFACIFFVGYSWTENHLLSTESQAVWSGFYEDRSMSYVSVSTIPRLFTWVAGAFPTMALLVGWQLRYLKHRGVEVPETEVAVLGRGAVAGLVLAAGCALWYGLQVDARVRDAVTSSTAGAPFLILAATGGLAQLVAWVLMLKSRDFGATWLWTATGGVLVTILGVTVLRELVRITTLDGGLESLYEQHAANAEVGGFVVFLVFAVANGALIVWVFRTIAKSAPGTDDPTTDR